MTQHDQDFVQETQQQKSKRARQILRRLKKEYGDNIGPFVEYSNPLELVVGTILSAQCTDVRVNMVTKTLFAKYRTARDYKNADLKKLEKEIYSTGFYKAKARYLKKTGRIIDEEFGGNVPNTVEDLLKLSGVSYKTAHLIMAKAHGRNVGVAVDTHVLRLAPRLGLSQNSDPTKMGRELAQLYPVKDYLNVNEYFITHGRAICVPRKPKCGECVLQDVCPSAAVN
jgi:endonuclease-3